MRRRNDPAVDVWSPLSVPAVAELLSGTPAWLSGGVALDHWLGRVTREHGDVDVSVTRGHLPSFLSTLPVSLRPFAAQDGWLTPLDELPSLAGVVNVWCRDDRSGRWSLQVNAEVGDDASWVYRRDSAVTLPWSDAVLVVDGVRTVAPQVQLLWKSRSPTATDEDDRRQVMPRLGPAAAEWLARSIRTAHPDSPWAADPADGDLHRAD
ncbi:nucleotidyltransferase domain-containing protein [Curtobacterium sp. MCBA15_001]|uniref:nucleotidyltransferase domain-containing protein n=1 Tax=Curtobacterium sp. MCBA15_001 TaxID=1898731 RepID=UPI0008DD8FED|nr:hypothetical protein [Curtobacterium sp. MCBA15_001]OIH97581.1 hypothetical protein BIU90_13425 [Curtobacterium sp. MCBA15_001]